MLKAIPIALAASVLAACTSGSPVLRYGLPDPVRATYTASDTVVITVDALGQSLELAVRSSATYGATFSGAPERVRVTLGIEALSAEVSVPMAEPIRMDESLVSGELVFALDPAGDVDVMSSPDVTETGGEFFSGVALAHSLFPGLPGREAKVGDSWVDTVSFEMGSGEAVSSQHDVLEYTVRGEVRRDGRSLVEIGFAGTSEGSQTLSFGVMQVRQTTELQVDGTLFWDPARGLVRERTMRAVGTGSVRVPIAPVALATKVESSSRVRLDDR